MVNTLPDPGPDPAVQQALALANGYLRAGNITGAEAALAPFFAKALPAEPLLLNALGLVRQNQGRLAEAVALFGEAARLSPAQAQFAFNQGRALVGLGQPVAAEAAFWAALAIKPDFVDALYELGSLLHQAGQLAPAEDAFRRILQLAPDHVPATLLLGTVLVDQGQYAQAEPVLRRALERARDPRMRGVLNNNLGLALRRLRRDDEALAAYDAAAAFDPAMPGLATHRSEALQNLKRHDEAVEVLRAALARDPSDAALHYRYNDLLFRLQHADYLKSYDRAPASRELKLGKAFFLKHEKRAEESYELYGELRRQDPGDPIAMQGAATALTMMKRHHEAIAVFDALLSRVTPDPELLAAAAEPALLGGDPRRALHLLERALAMDPLDQGCIAMKSVALRLLDDGRDDALNGYDRLVQSFELAPPDGFSSMADFNIALNAELDRLHPDTRGFIQQSLRGGTQTPDMLFDSALPLVGALRARIDEAVTRYIAELPQDARHPFLSRRAAGFRYSGSWSSRLRDCGFHVNHIHQKGWISSCYYVAVPDAARDSQQRQGWIKFGESSFDVALKDPVRRVIQPEPGRLVLFPSYMWHGTVPFHDTAARTTIAFDVVPG